MPVIKRKTKKAGRRKGEDWNSKQTSFDYRVGSVSMGPIRMDSLALQDQYSSVIALGDLFLVAEHKGPPSRKRLYLSNQLTLRFTQLYVYGHPLDENLAAAEVLADTIHYLMVFGRHPDPGLAIRNQTTIHSKHAKTSEHHAKEPSELESQISMWWTAKDIGAMSHPELIEYTRGLLGWLWLFRPKAEALAAHLAGDRGPDNAQTGFTEPLKSQAEMQRIFERAAFRLSSPFTPARPKKSAWTCKYGDSHYVPVEIALIEGAFKLTAKNVEEGRLELPTKAEVWKWVRENVITFDPWPARITALFDRAGLKSLPRSDTGSYICAI